jgi:hypothetical protein
MKIFGVRLPPQTNVLKGNRLLDFLHHSPAHLQEIAAVAIAFDLQRDDKLYCLDFDGYELEALLIAKQLGLLEELEDGLPTDNPKLLTKLGFTKIWDDAGHETWRFGNYALSFANLAKTEYTPPAIWVRIPG